MKVEYDVMKTAPKGKIMAIVNKKWTYVCKRCMEEICKCKTNYWEGTGVSKADADKILESVVEGGSQVGL